MNIGLYFVSREYGGPEEGRWYYNLYRHISSSRRIKARKANKTIRRMREIHADKDGIAKEPRHRLSSTLSEGHYRLMPETFPSEHATRITPHYE